MLVLTFTLLSQRWIIQVQKDMQLSEHTALINIFSTKFDFTKIQHFLQSTESFIRNNFKFILLKNGKLTSCILILDCNGVCFAVSELNV